MVSQELTSVTETIQKIMEIWQQNKKKNFIVKIPFSHDFKEFKTLLKQMIIHYQLPVRTTIEQAPIEMRCKCGHIWETRVDAESLCPKCKNNNIKILSGKEIQVF